MPGRPRSATTFVANSTSGSVMEARTSQDGLSRVASRMSVPLFASSLDAYQERIAERLTDVAASGKYILGPEVEAFEREFAAYVGVEHCVGVGNGTDALVIALQALGVGPGDEVVVPSFTFYATAEAVAAIGATPVFCDVDPDTFCVTAETRRGRAQRAHQGDRRRPPVRQPRTRRASSSASASRGRGRRPGRRRDARRGQGRRARRCRARSRSSPPRTSPASATAARSSPTTPSLRRSLGGCATTARPTSKPTARLAGTPASTRSRRRCCASCCQSSTAGTTRAARLRPRTRRAGSAPSTGSRSRHPTDGTHHVYHLYVVRHERADELAETLAQAPESAPAPTTAGRSISSPRWSGSSPTGLELPGTD